MEQQSSKKWIWLSLGIFFLLLVIGGLFFYFFGAQKNVGESKNVFPFGVSESEDTLRPDVETDRHEVGGFDATGIIDTTENDKLFRRLTEAPIAGSYALERGGQQYVRYIEKETGHAYEIAIAGGAPRQISNTTIPRVAIADWADDGNTVVLRYLEEDPISGREVIKTHLAKIRLPSETSPDSTGSLAIEFLPDNITALSVAPNGKDLFYLLKKGNEFAGSIVNIGTRTVKEVFRNSFGEWTPQLLNDGTIILATKPSANVHGYSYRYDPKTKALKRLVREKNGLTTMGNPSGSRILYGEMISKNAVLGVYNSSGFTGDEGFIFYENTIPLTTLPEKCSWFKDGIHIFCGAFLTMPRGAIPDTWYQGLFFFNDTFWFANGDTGDIKYIADPKEETGQEFDVTNPMLSKNEEYFIFTNKKDGVLWAMRIPAQTTDRNAFPPADITPNELHGAN